MAPDVITEDVEGNFLGEMTFPGDGNHDHHPAQEREQDSAQEVDPFTSFATTKPEIVENGIQTGVSGVLLPHRRSCSNITALAAVKHWLDTSRFTIHRYSRPRYVLVIFLGVYMA